MPRWAPFAVIVGAHVALLVGLLQIDSVRERIVEAAPLFVRFITPRPAEVVPPPPQARPEPKPVPRMIASSKPSTSLMRAAPVVEQQVAVAATPAPSASPSESSPPQAPQQAVALPVPITPPRASGAGLDNAAAEYPLMSRRLKETGRVVLRVLVNPAGAADRVELEKSSGFERLDESARSAVRGWRFFPARQGDLPIAQWVNVSVPFELTRS